MRNRSVELCSPLAIEDYGVQPMDDASPPKWHLAHTTWFFETFILKEAVADYRVFHEQFEHLFNSYYNGVGTPFPRPRRGLLSRPTVAQTLDYRQHVDAALLQLIEEGLNEAMVDRVVLGLNHEQQHQELLITDLKYNFGNNPLYPAYCSHALDAGDNQVMGFMELPGGIFEVGAGDQTGDRTGDRAGFAFDNEFPRHRVLLEPFALADRLVTNDEYLEFVEAGGYAQSQLWLSEGWSAVQQNGWRAPLYWVQRDGAWWEYRLDGLSPLQGDLPVTHVSAFEAHAYASWRNARLPTEFEWEAACEYAGANGCFAERDTFHPSVCPAGSGLRQMFGDVWEWTASSYGPYPGYAPLPGTLGEYNGKFMSSQLVLRGGSCATPEDHIRPSYRNFFYPPDRWQFSGIRLARNV